MMYIKGIAVLLVLAALIGSAIWIRGVFAERNELRISEKAAVQNANDIIQARNKDVALQKGVADAVKNIRIQSDVYIQSLEDSKPPIANDGDTVVVIPSGMPQTMYTMPTGFKNSSTSRTSTTSQGG
jgi:septal ring-binding cell division protein DamX